MKLREMDRAYVRGDDTPHLVFLGSSTFCGRRTIVGAFDTKFEDVCPRCISSAKHMGGRA